MKQRETQFVCVDNDATLTNLQKERQQQLQKLILSWTNLFKAFQDPGQELMSIQHAILQIHTNLCNRLPNFCGHFTHMCL